MRKVSKFAAIAGIGMLAFSGQAVAEESESWIPGEFSGNVATYSDYSFRGVSQTNRNIALQGGIDWSHDIGIYLGIWASNVDIGDADLEQDVYGGYAGEIGSFSYDAGVIFFYYAKEEAANYWEFPINLGYDFDVFSLSAGALWSPDYFGTLGDGWYLSTGIAVPLPLGIPGIDLSTDANVGYTNAKEVVSATRDSYIDYNLGLVVGLPQNLGIDLRWVGTDADGPLGSKIAGDRFVAGLTYSF